MSASPRRRWTLILGGARSGKSAEARRLAKEEGGKVLHVATAEPLDAEMAARIAIHRAERPAGWTTLEAPRRAGEAIIAAEAGHRVVVLDCFTLLASNAIAPLPPPVDEAAAVAALEPELEGLLEARRRSAARWIVVSNEVGLGIVPAEPLGRAYRDALGRAHRRLAAEADEVLLLVAGLPLRLK